METAAGAPGPETLFDDAGVSFVIAARNEAPTIRGVVKACHAAGEMLSFPYEVLVVSDGSTDATASVAEGSGALVIERIAQRGSKAEALRTGAMRATGGFLFFVDGDLVGLGGHHLAAIARPVLERKAAMAVGTFDYRVGARLVQRVPWSTGERIIRRDLFDVNDPRLDGYNIESIISEAVGRQQGRTVSMRMRGVRQRSKAQKLGPLKGTMANVRMWRAIAESSHLIDENAYRSYANRVVLSDGGCASATREQARVLTSASVVALSGLARVLRNLPHSDRSRQ